MRPAAFSFAEAHWRAYNGGMRRLPALLLACCLTACQTATPTVALTPPLTLQPGYARLVFDVVDETTGQPVTANITIRRERTDGTPIDESETYSGAHVEIEAAVDPGIYVWVLVEASGYQDWEIRLKVSKPGAASGPIRLKRSPTPTQPPGVQGQHPRKRPNQT